MTNMERWENFLKRKGWKYKKITGSYGERWFVKTYHNSMRCHMFISENKLNFSFYKGYKTNAAGGGTTIHRSMNTQYCLVKKAGSLNIFQKPKNKHVMNLALSGPTMLMKSMKDVIVRTKKGPMNRMGQKVYSTEARNKMCQTLEFFLKLNGFSIGEINEANLLDLCYPSLKNFPVKNLHGSGVTHIFRKPGLGFHALCKKIFKCKSKIITKLILSEDKELRILRHPSVRDLIELGYTFKPFFNRGEMEQFLQLTTIGTFGLGGMGASRGIRMQRKFFRKFTSKQLLHLFSQQHSTYDVMDSVRQWSEFPTKITIPDKVQTWKFVHDEISRQYRKLGQEDYEFNLKPNVKKLHGIQVDNETIVVPHTRHELIDWGTKMNNCIAGYHSQFNQGHTILLGVKEGEEIKYNIEITNGQVRQFMKNRNVQAPKEVIEKFIKVFIEHKLVNGENCAILRGW